MPKYVDWKVRLDTLYRLWWKYKGDLEMIAEEMDTTPGTAKKWVEAGRRAGGDFPRATYGVRPDVSRWTPKARPEGME